MSLWKMVDLKSGEVICDKCRGTGISKAEFSISDISVVCNKCNGKGKVDWIENLVGSEEQKYVVKYDSKSGKFSVSESILNNEESLKIILRAKESVRKMNE